MKLPPLNPLKAFEAAGRHKSLALASNELAVTPAAVSRQVKALEDHLGVRLFVRGHRQIALTPVGADYHADVSKVLLQLSSATAAIKETTTAGPLRISATRTFLRTWLLPRFDSFSRAHPNISLDLVVKDSGQPQDENAVAAIDAGRNLPAGYVSDRLFEIVLVPVCSPDYLKAHATISRPEDLVDQVLLNSGKQYNDWGVWFHGFGIEPPPVVRSWVFSEYGIAYEAARQGIGIVMGRLHLINAAVESGMLVIPVRQFVRSGRFYHLVYRRKDRQRRDLQTFRRWIMAEIAAERDFLRSPASVEAPVGAPA